MSTESPQLDDALRKLRRDVGVDRFANMMQAFFAEAETVLAIMHNATASGDTIALQRAAHRMRGSAAALGHPALLEASTELMERHREHAGETDEKDVQLIGEIARHVDSIHDLLARLQGAVAPNPIRRQDAGAQLLIQLVVSGDGPSTLRLSSAMDRWAAKFEGGVHCELIDLRKQKASLDVALTPSVIVTTPETTRVFIDHFPSDALNELSASQ